MFAAGFPDDEFTGSKSREPSLQKCNGADRCGGMTDFGRLLVTVCSWEQGKAPGAGLLPAIELDALEERL